MSRTWSRGLMVIVIIQACGCALTAKRTPTPAAQIDGKALAQTLPPPNERYYVIFFGSQDLFHHPKYCHTWATLALEQGIHPRVCKERLGHSTIKLSFDRYGHLFPSLDDRLREGLEELWRAGRDEAASARGGSVVPLRH